MKYLLIIITFIALKQCKTTPPPEDITGLWTIAAINNDVSVAELKGANFNINLSENNISTTIGCNRHNCTIVEASESTFQLNNCLSTEMYCKDLNDIESQLKEALGAITNYSLKEKQLHLKDSANQTKILLKK